MELPGCLPRIGCQTGFLSAEPSFENELEIFVLQRLVLKCVSTGLMLTEFDS